jgi:hypothetical protein
MNTAEVFFQFEVEEGVDKDSLAQSIQEHFEGMAIVQQAEAMPEEMQVIGIDDVAIGIALGVVVLRSSREGTEELTKLIKAVKELVAELKGVKTARTEVGDEQVPVGQMDDEKIQELAEGS